MQSDHALKKYTLLVAAMASFLTPFMGSAINLAIPAIGKEFNCNTFMLSWVATSYLLASAAFLVPLGRLADITGRKKIFILGISFFGLSSILCGLAWSVEILILFRILQGIGSAMIFGTAMAMLTSVFPPHERGRVLGINVASVYTGLSLGPVLGGTLNHNLGWQSIFYFTALVSILAVILTLAKLKEEWAGAAGEKFDFTGSLLYSIGLATLMYGVSSVTSSEWAKYLLVFGLFILVVFVRYEINAKQPVLNIKLFTANVTFAFSNLAALINYCATFAVAFLLSLYLQVVLGYNSQAAGLILLSQPVLMALLSPLAGTLSDKIQPRVVASCGMALTTLTLLVFCFLTENTSLWLIIANLALLGTGLALFSSPNTNAVMGAVEKKFFGVASSTIGTMRLTGQTVSMATVTLLLALYLGNTELSRANPVLLVKSTRMLFAIFTVLCFGGIFASLARGDLSSREKA
jgi:EmrB/QacA subfamily drug resistance transporter